MSCLTAMSKANSLLLSSLFCFDLKEPTVFLWQSGVNWGSNHLHVNLKSFTGVAEVHSHLSGPLQVIQGDTWNYWRKDDRNVDKTNLNPRMVSQHDYGWLYHKHCSLLWQTTIKGYSFLYPARLMDSVATQLMCDISCKTLLSGTRLISAIGVLNQLRKGFLRLLRSQRWKLITTDCYLVVFWEPLSARHVTR